MIHVENLYSPIGIYIYIHLYSMIFIPKMLSKLEFYNNGLIGPSILNIGMHHSVLTWVGHIGIGIL